MADATPNPAAKDYIFLDDPPPPMTPLDFARVGELTKLACKRFPDLWEAEKEVVRVSAMFVDPQKPDGKLLPVRAEFLRWLATDPEAVPHISSKGIRAFGVAIGGDFDLWGCRIGVPMTLWRCTVEKIINLQSAETKDLFLFNCTIGGGMPADRILVNGPLYLRGSIFSGAVSLLGAQIKGDLDCDGAQILVKDGYALNFASSRIEGDAFLINGFTTSGEVRLVGAQIKGYLDLSGASISVEKGNGLSADSARIDGNVFFGKGFKSTGAIRLISAHLGRDLSFMGAEVGEVYCANMELSGDMQWLGVTKSNDTYLDLTGATVKNLHDDQASWPNVDRLVLNGLNYAELTLHERPKPEQIDEGSLSGIRALEAGDRIAWLKLQLLARRTEQQPWMRLSSFLEAKGDHKGAKHVLYKLSSLQAHSLEWHPLEEMRKDLRKFAALLTLFFVPWNREHPAWPYLRNPNRSWAIAFAWLEEAPQRILYSIALTLLLGTLVFAGASRNGAMIRTDAKAELDHYPPFQPFVYTLENAVPLVKLGVDEKWAPDPHPKLKPWFPGLSWLDWLMVFNSYWFLAVSRWLLILSGWFQASVLAAALSGIFKE